MNLYRELKSPLGAFLLVLSLASAPKSVLGQESRPSRSVLQGQILSPLLEQMRAQDQRNSRSVGGLTGSGRLSAPTEEQVQETMRLDQIREKLGLLGDTVTTLEQPKFPADLKKYEKGELERIRRSLEQNNFKPVGRFRASGGSGIICFKDSEVAEEAFQSGQLNYSYLNRAKLLQVLDYWESETPDDFFLPEKGETPEGFTWRIVREYLHGVRATSAALAYYGINSLNRAERAELSPLPQVEDVEPLKRSIPHNCRLVQLAIQYVAMGEARQVPSSGFGSGEDTNSIAQPIASQVYMYFDKRLLDKILELNKPEVGTLNLAMLHLHEAYYLIAKEKGATTSASVRELVRNDFSRSTFEKYGPICWGHAPVSYSTATGLLNLALFGEEAKKAPNVILYSEPEQIYNKVLYGAKDLSRRIRRLHEAAQGSMSAAGVEQLLGYYLQKRLVDEGSAAEAFVATSFMAWYAMESGGKLPDFRELLNGAIGDIGAYCEMLDLERSIFKVLPFRSCDRSYVPLLEKAVRFCEEASSGRLNYDSSRIIDECGTLDDCVRTFPEFQERVCPPADCPHLYK